MIEIGGSKEMGWGTAARGGLGGGKVVPHGGERESKAVVCVKREKEKREMLEPNGSNTFYHV